MTKFFKGLFALIVLPLLMLLTGCNSDDVSSEPTVKLERIDITASPLTTRGVSQLTLAVGDKQPFDVVGHYSDGSSRILTDSNAVDWHASDLDVVLFDAPGIITGNTPGVVTVHASSGNIASNDVMVNVSSAEITEITVTPSPVQVAQGQTQQLTAMATYSDGTSSDVTNSVTWTPTDTVTATVTTEGLLSGVEENSTTLTATKAGVTSNEVTVNVSSAEITEITVTPSQVNIAKGQTQQLTAIATYSDGTSSSVTNSVMWTPADANTATVTSTGLITGVGVGSTTMAVTKDGITSNTVNVTVSSAVITAIQVTPSQVNVAKGQTEQLTAIATYSDTTSSDISNSVTWTAADTNTATVTLDGLLTGVEVGSTTVTATKDGIASNAVNVTISSAVITAIQVTPSQVNVAKGQTQQLTAIATYSDTTSSDISSSVTWTSGDTNTATVTSTGLLTGVELGSTTVTATKDGIASNTVNVTVSSAVITAIQVTPSSVSVAKGQTEQLTAIATYSDTTSSDISSLVTWTPADTNTITVTSTGLITGVEVGSTTVTATKDGIASNAVNATVSSAVITAIQVTPSPVSVAKGQTEQLTAIATYSDTTSSDISSLVTWTPADTNTATVTSTGLLTGVEVGSTTVTATKDGIASNAVNATVSSAVITAIQVTPSQVNVAKGQTEQLTAIATYSDTTSSDISSSVTWTPADTNTATVTSTGLLTGVEVGSTTVTATKDGITSNTVNVTVSSAVITAIQVTPSPVSVAKGQTEQLTAIATYSDTTSSDISSSVTWTPADTNTATVTSTGLLTGVEVGSTTVTATKDGITSNTVNVTVSSAVITAIQVTPSPVSVAKGQTEQLTAIATYSDTTSSDISSLVTWTPADTNTITVTSTGLITGVEVGSTTVTATKNGISNSVNVTVSSAVITAIQVTPTTVNVAKDLNGQLTATATYSDGTSSSVTKSVTWMSVDTNTATVTLDGLLTGVEVGSTTVTAIEDGIASNQVNVNVCADLAGVCIDIFDIGSGTLFTNSPSVAYLNSIGGSTIANDVTTETGIDGPIGDFYRFKWDNANALCEIYNAQNLGGRTNWRLAESDELLNELYVGFGNMFKARGWPTDYWYWSKTADLSNPVNYDTLLLSDGIPVSASPAAILYVSCVSNP